MILTIDVGNTNIVLGTWTDGKLNFVSRVETDREKTGDSYTVALKSILELYDVSPRTIQGAIISSVVPQISGPMAGAVERLTGRRPLFVGPGVKTGLNIRIDNPAQLGSDIVADAVAVLNKYDMPVVFIDMGTATKICAVDKAGNFLGCAIMPGVFIGMDALTYRTASLPQIALDAPRSVIGANTVDSMQSGVVYGTASMIDGMIGRFEEQLGEPATVVATGGVSGDIVPHCRRRIIHDPDLLLEGLYRIYCRNQPSRL